MRRLAIFTAGIFLFLWSGVSSLEEMPRITMMVAPDKITVGDRVTLTFQVDLPKDSHIVSARFKENFVDLAVKETGKSIPASLEGGKVRYTVWAIVTAYTTGTFSIPPLSVAVKHPDGTETTLESLEETFEVASIIPEGDPMTDIRDIQEVVSLPTFLIWPWLLMGLSVFSVVLFSIFLRRKRKVKTAPSLSPHLSALEALEKIETMGWAYRDRKEYYFLVSGVLRRYLEERFGINAPEKTTEEFMASASTHPLLTETQKELLHRFLKECDLVKFARFDPDGEETSAVGREARYFIQQTGGMN